MKYFIAIAVVLTLSSQLISQGIKLRLNETKPVESKLNSLTGADYTQTVQNNLFDSVTTPKEKTSVRRSTKSPGLAFIYGLFIPGMGHVYSNKFSSGKYFMISEAALWLTYAAFTIYGNWLIDDSYTFASNHAGIKVDGKDKDDKFFVNVANYNNVEEYNNEKLRFGLYEEVYLPGTGYDFYWDSEANRKLYRDDKIGGDRTLNDRLFVIGAVLINHVVSAISAVFAANSYNSKLKEKGSGGLMVRAGVQKHFNRIDGIKLNFTKLF